MLYRVGKKVYADHPDGSYIEVAAALGEDGEKMIAAKKGSLDALPDDAEPMTLSEALIVMQPEVKPSKSPRKKGGEKDVSDV